MLRNQNSKPFVHVSGAFYLYLAVLLLALPLRWVIAFLLCAATHELFHLLVASVLGVQIGQIEIAPGGARIHAQPVTHFQELLCALAGPVGGLLPITLLRIFPEAALWAVLLTVYNMLPIYPSDGGRVLRSTLYMLFPTQFACRLGNAVEWAVRIGMILLGIYAAFVLRLGSMALIICLLPAIRGKIPKILAKKEKTEYNSSNHE